MNDSNMSTEPPKSPKLEYIKSEPDLCRCCHSEGSYQHLYTPYFWLKDVENVVYSDMIQECFNVEFVKMPESLAMLCAICSTCIQKLNDAVRFKQQILKCEKLFQEIYNGITCPDGVISNSASCNGKTDVPNDKKQTHDDDNTANDDDGINGDNNMETSPEENVGKLGKKLANAKQKNSLGMLREFDENEEKLVIIHGMSLIKVKNVPVKKGVDFEAKDDIYHCLRCSEVTSGCRPTAMQNHILKNHLRTPRFKCPTCFEPFWELRSVIEHKFEVHDIDNRYKCDVCKMVFYNRTNLSTHKQRHRKKTVKCEYCKYVTFNNSRLTRHMLSHSDIRIYQCKYCSKKCKTRGALTFHERIHEGDKRKLCLECGEAFVQRASLKYHMEKRHPGVKF